MSIAEILLAVGGIIVGVVVVILIVAAMQPAQFRVSRSASIKASPAEIFAQVNDLHNMNTWNPWLEPDPNIKLTYDGPPAGTGALYNWDGNGNVGAGRLTIVDSHPSTSIRIKLDFFRPFASTADAEFTFKTEGDQTIVTWTMDGQKIFLTKLFGLIMSMDKMIGGNFEKGLANLKARVEGSPKTTAVQS